MSNHPHPVPSNGHKAPVPQVVQPGPVDFTFNVAEAFVGTERRVVLTFYTPQGVTVIFVPPEHAKKMADVIRTVATGITLP